MKSYTKIEIKTEVLLDEEQMKELMGYWENAKYIIESAHQD